MTQEEILAEIEKVKAEQKQHEQNYLMCAGVLNYLNSKLEKDD